MARVAWLSATFGSRRLSTAKCCVYFTNKHKATQPVYSHPVLIISRCTRPDQQINSFVAQSVAPSRSAFCGIIQMRCQWLALGSLHFGFTPFFHSALHYPVQGNGVSPIPGWLKTIWIFPLAFP
ncbi:hypothetical protein B0T22DRAFT_123185 [Podospora appendiculata]|uniref:Uncharacterized protein n=1 Tax=Podospora appendiculata TaxID=314037 RepID=A0AAE0X6Z8_9PEZI|nr:hypothetical protein B0T22DRAFT_123185 [Podospora appendiculata]